MVPSPNLGFRSVGCLATFTMKVEVTSLPGA